MWRGPEHFEWCREDPCDSYTTFYTNWVITEATNHNSPVKIAWLLEPPSIQEWPYSWVSKAAYWFNAILTYDKRLLDVGGNRVKFAPHGGSWIDWDLWGMHEKTKDICMIVSDKKDSEGHKLRHEIAKEFSDVIDIYGPSFQTFDRKWDVLRHYRYCVVVESVKMDYYFSEKLIDAISVGCMPIYWGCPSIGDYFKRGGLLTFNNIDRLAHHLNLLTNTYRFVAEDVMADNIEIAKQYRMPEDWMFEHYPELFR